jgi:hypothetical protein
MSSHISIIPSRNILIIRLIQNEIITASKTWKRDVNNSCLRQLGTNNVQLHDIESRKHSPGELMRKKLEVFFVRKINWFIVTNPNNEPREPV